MMLCGNCYSIMIEIEDTESLVMQYYFCKNCGSYTITTNPKFAPKLAEVTLHVKECPIYKQVEGRS